MNTRKTQLPTMQTRAMVLPTTVNEADRTVEICFTTGERGLRKPYWDEPYYEELDVSTTAIRAERLDKGLSVIDSHRTYEGIDGVFGITTNWRIDGGELIGTVKFADDEDSDKIFRKVAQGILPHVSLGYIIHRMQRIGDEDDVPVYSVIDWSPTELSIVPVSFETTNGVRSGEPNHNTNDCIIEDTKDMFIKRNKKRSPEQDPTAPKGSAGSVSGEEETRAITAPTTPAPAAVIAPPTVDESSVRSGITAFTAAAKQAGFDTDHAVRAFGENVSIDSYRAALLEELGNRSAKNAPNAPMVDDKRQDHVSVKREHLGDAIAARMTGDFTKLDEHSRKFAQMPVMEAVRHYMAEQGDKSVYGMSTLNFAGRALQSTGDLPLILENVMNKELLAAYEETQRTFTNFCRRTTVNDFRNKNTYKMGDAPDLLPLGENGEYKYGKFSESKESYRISTYARKIGFTRQMMINDDLSALSRFPQLFGGAASRLESDIVWGLLLNYDFIRKQAASHTLSDNKALFHADHANLLTGAGNALSTDALSAMRKLGRNQKTLDGNFMNIAYNVLAVGSTLETTAQKILNGTIMANKTSDVNVFKESMDLIVEPRIDAVTGGDTSFYAFSRMAQAVEYAYLAGNEGLYTEIVDSTDIDGTTILARHDFGAGFEDYRGAAKSTGA